jgi:peptidyl-prolyl cis-trans isomerase D
MSEDNTAARGGELGCLLKGKTPKPIEEAVAGLAAGKVSDVITTEAGFYIVKLDQIAKDADAEKLGRAQTARDGYLAQESERLAVEASKKVAAAVKGGKSLKEALDLFLAELAPVTTGGPSPPQGKAASKKKADEKKSDDDRPALSVLNHPARPVLETTMPFNINNDPIPGVRQTADLAKVAFALEKPGDSPGDILPFDSGYIAIQLKEKTPASKEEWDKNKEFYLATLRANKANDALVAYVKHLRDAPGGEAKFTKELVEDKKGGDTAPPADDDSGE